MTEVPNPPIATNGSDGSTGRNLGVVGFVVLVVVYLSLIQGMGQLLTIGRDTGYVEVTSIDIMWRTILVPVGLSLVLVYGVVSWLGWWRPVWVDDRPVQRWLIIIPIVMAVSILVVTDYGALATKGLGFSLLLLLGSLMVGFGEEGMFRGLGVTVFRRRGFTEARVALFSTLLFGVAHSSNLLSEGPSVLGQVLVTIVAGYFFYLIRRRSGGLLLPALMHALWDFSLISGRTVPGESYNPALLAFVAKAVLVIIVFARRKHIEPDSATR